MGKDANAYGYIKTKLQNLKNKLGALGWVDMVFSIIGFILLLIFAVKKDRNTYIFWMFGQTFHIFTIIMFNVASRRERIWNIRAAAVASGVASVADIVTLIVRFAAFGVCESCTTVPQLPATLLPFFLVICYIILDVLSWFVLAKMFYAKKEWTTIEGSGLLSSTNDTVSNQQQQSSPNTQGQSVITMPQNSQFSYAQYPPTPPLQSNIDYSLSIPQYNSLPIHTNAPSQSKYTNINKKRPDISGEFLVVA